MSNTTFDGAHGLAPFYEIRRYFAKPGRRADLARLMEERILPF